MRWFALLAVAALAGCTTTPAGPDDSVPAAPLPTGYVVGCDHDPPPCAVIVSQTESQQEPYAAVHPHHPEVFVVGVNAGHTVNGVVADPAAPSFDAVRLDLWFTEDGGASWRQSTLPAIEDPAVTFEPVHFTVVGDPAIVIDEHGVTHVSGIASHSWLRGYNVFYVSSPDLGRTWNEPVVLTDDDDNDRNWMDRGPDGTLYVAWQNVGSSVQVAWSKDGAHWKVTPELGDCITVSPMAFAGHEPWTACAGTGDGESGHIQVLRLDRHANRLEARATVPAECYWPKLSIADVWVITGEFCGNDIMWSTSPDGAHWSAPQPIADVVGKAAAGVMWQATDPWGRVHLMLDHQSTLELHTIDPATGASLGSTVLRTPRDPAEQAIASHQNSLGPDYGDHYYGLAWGAERGVATWTDARTIQVAFVAPVG